VDSDLYTNKTSLLLLIKVILDINKLLISKHCFITCIIDQNGIRFIVKKLENYYIGLLKKSKTL